MSSTQPPPGSDAGTDPGQQVGASIDPAVDPGTSRPSLAVRLRGVWGARAAAYRSRSLAWRTATPAVFLLAGALFVTSAVSSDGTDLRASRFGDLGSVVRQQTGEVEALNQERDTLAAEVESLSARMRGTGVSAAQAEVDRLEVPAGLAPMRGPGITVELDDASAEKIATSGTNPNNLVVHQQDIQAVANAMWAGGAEAMTIQGQRVIATTGIKCVGNTVVLRGVPYSPPYVLTAVGDPVGILDSLDDSPYIQRYRDYAEVYGLGWEVLPHSSVEVPGYAGSLDLEYARPAGGTRTSREDEDL